jgi:hypothetical protein
MSVIIFGTETARNITFRLMQVPAVHGAQAFFLGLLAFNRITSATTNTHKGGEATATVVAAKSHARVAKLLILEEEKVSQNAIKKSPGDQYVSSEQCPSFIIPGTVSNVSSKQQGKALQSLHLCCLETADSRRGRAAVPATPRYQLHVES